MVDEILAATGVPEPAAPKIPIKEMTEQQLRIYNRTNQTASRARRAKTKQAESLKASSKIEATKPEALELLRERIHSEHVVEVCYDLGLVAAQKHDLLTNKFYWAHGLTRTLASIDAEKPTTLDVPHDSVIQSEVIHQGDLYAIWDYSVSWRENISFDSFITKRAELKSDWIVLGKFMDIPFEEQPHRVWQEHLPQFTPDLKPGYSLQDMQNWFKRQKSQIYPDTVRDFLLMAPRGSMKTTAGRCFLICAMLCAPSARLVIITETTRLARSSVKAFRAVWEVGHEPTRIQYWFPEHCIEQGEGSILEFSSPMRTIALPQETLMHGSFETALTGSRFDLAWIDDGVSNLTTANEEARQKGLDIYDALLKLRQPGGGSLVVTVGTPWSGPDSGDLGDLYYELGRRNDDDPDKSLGILVQPAWIIPDPDTARKFPDNLNELTEQDVILAYPNVLTFRELIKQARANINLFRTQLLCEYVASEEDKWQLTWTKSDLEAATHPASYFSGHRVLRVVAAVDTATSTSIHADRSSVTIAHIIEMNGKSVAVVVDVIADRWKYSTLAEKLVEIFALHRVQQAVIEKTNVPAEDLQASMQRHAYIRGYVLPDIKWTVSKGIVGQGAPLKLRRAKATEVLLSNGQLLFQSGLYTEDLFTELMNPHFMQGRRSSATKKDDRADSTCLMALNFIIRDQGGMYEQSEAEKEEEMKMLTRQILKAQHEAYFGSPTTQQLPPPPEQAEPEAPNPLYGTLSRYGMTRQ